METVQYKEFTLELADKYIFLSVGDEVYSENYGIGKISDIRFHNPHPLRAEFEDDYQVWYTPQGKWHHSDKDWIRKNARKVLNKYLTSSIQQLDYPIF